jgi:hypothetical protein
MYDVSRRKLIKWTIIGAVIVAAAPMALPLFAKLAGKGAGYQDLVLDRLRGCKVAREMLGDDIDVSLVGVAWGSSSTRNGQWGNAQWRVPVSGSLASGVYQYALELHGGQWSMLRGQLEIGGRVVDVARCPQSTGQTADIPLGMTGGPEAVAAAHAAVACFKRKDLACAEANSRTGCNLGDIAACANLAHVLQENLGDYRGAVAPAQTACQANDASGCVNLGEALRKLGDLAGANQALSRSCALGLDIGCALLAYLDLQRGDPETAFQSAQKALALNPNRSSAFRQIGHTRLLSGDVDQALTHYVRALQTAAIQDQGLGVVEDRKDTPQGLVRQELGDLARVYPARAGEVQQILARLAALMPPDAVQ